jgi:virulence factor Mce-like protein
VRRLLPVLLVLTLLPACSIGGGGGSYEVAVDFPRAVSLYPSSAVQVLGLGAGTVRSVEPAGDHVHVVLAISDDVPIPADAVAAIVPQSLIGERHVQLHPAWTEGDERMKDGATIPIERTVIPVEPDEALAALKEFLDAMDPKGTGRLIENAADSLEGNGATLGRALHQLADLNSTLAAKDDQLVSIVESLDQFTATMVTREDELGDVLDLFAGATGALADERKQIEALVTGLADVSTRGLDLVSKNGEQLRRDIDVLTTTLQSVDGNLGAVHDLLSSADDFPAGISNAVDPPLRRIDLRQQFSPLVSELLDTVPGLPPAVCLPVDVSCDLTALPTPSVSGRSSATSRVTVLGPSRAQDGPSTARDPSWAGRVAGGAGAVGRFFGRSAKSLLGVGG